MQTTESVTARRIRRHAAKRGLTLRISRDDGTCYLIDPRDHVAAGSLQDVERYLAEADDHEERGE